MQVNRTGWFLFALFGLGGLAMIAAPVPMAGGTLKVIGVIWVGVTIALMAYARAQKRKSEHQQWVWRNGVRGRATVLEAGSNMTMNEMPVMKLELELDVPGQQRRRVGHSETMPVFAAQRMQPGLVLPVYVNPQDPGDFVLVW